MAYWKAQCAFRGLNQTGAIADLQLRIREAKKPMLPELKEAEKEINKEFRKSNKIARDGSWKSLKSAEQKVKADPKKYLAEVFPKGATGRPANLDIVVVKIGTDERFKLSEAAEKMGLETVSVDAPWTGNKRPSPDRWVIVGRTRDAVWNQMREIERETARSKQTLPKEKEKAKPHAPKQNPVTNPPDVLPKMKAPQAKQTARKQVLHQPLASIARRTAPLPASVPPSAAVPKRVTSKPSPAPSPKPRVASATKVARKTPPTAQNLEGPEFSRDVKPNMPSAANAKSENSPFDVRGSYVIRCPDIESQWDDGDGLTLDLYLEPQNGKMQLFAFFDFRVIRGIMRFEKPVPVSKKEKMEEPSKKRKWDEDEDGDIDMEDIDVYSLHDHSYGSREKYDKKVFFLGANDKPTARRPVWKYRWRGRETGEDVIQLYADEKVSSITFSKKGTELVGTFKSDMIEDCQFTGVKVSSHAQGSHDNPETQWEEYSEEAYNHANSARWGGW